MGVQIFNKDVSVVSSIKGIAKANINNVGGIGGWSGGGGGDVTPNPTPDWIDVTQPSFPIYTNTVQIQGITVPITLSFTDISPDGFTINASVNTVNAYGGTITNYTGPGTTFIVNPNQYVTFAATDGGFGSAAINVNNVSDGGILLDYVVLTFDVP